MIAVDTNILVYAHRRDSAFIDGSRHDAHAVVHHLTGGAVPMTADSRRALTGEEQA